MPSTENFIKMFTGKDNRHLRTCRNYRAGLPLVLQLKLTLLMILQTPSVFYRLYRRVLELVMLIMKDNSQN